MKESTSTSRRKVSASKGRSLVDKVDGVLGPVWYGVRDIVEYIPRKLHKRFKQKQELKKLPPKVRALQALLERYPDLLAVSPYDQLMREHWRKHPPKHRKPSPTPRIGGHAYG